ncbi:MAG: MFS transporter [Limnochordia bacterium]
MSQENPSLQDASTQLESSRQLWLTNIITLLSFTALTVVKPFIPLYAASLGASTLAVGLVVSSFSFLPFFLAIPTGILTDLWGAKRLIVLGSVGGVAGMVLASSFPNLVILSISQGILGVSQLFVIVAIQTFIGSLGEGRARDANFGLFTTSSSAGQLIGPLIGGRLVDSLGYRAAIGISALLSIIPVLLALNLRETKAALGANRSLMADLHQVPRLLQNDGVKTAIASSFVVLFVEGLRDAFYPLYLDHLGFSVTIIGVLLSVRSLMAITIRLFIPVICEHFGRYFSLLGGMVLMAAGVMLTPLLSGFWPLAFASGLMGTGMGLTQPLSMIAVADNTEPHELGFAMGVRMTGNRLAQFVNPVFFGITSQLVGIGNSFLLAGVLLLSTTGLLLRWRSTFRDK